MVKIISELEKIGFEITDEQKESIKKSIGEELYSKQELDKKISKVETERDNYKKRADTAEDTLKGFDGKDFDEITKDRDEWKRKAEQAEKDFNAKIAERDKNDLLEKAFKDIKFSSESAKKAVMADIAASVTVKDGKLIGFNDLLDEAKKNDAGAFIDEQSRQSDQNQATFTTPMGSGTHTEPITGDPNKMDFATYKKWREQNQ